MSILIKNNFGTIEISKEVIAVLSGVAATECYGVVGMASRKIKDGIAELLKKENFSKGIEVRNDGKSVEIDLHVIVAFGTKLSEVSHNIQTRVKYSLEEALGVSVSAINIYIQGVRIINE